MRRYREILRHLPTLLLATGLIAGDLAAQGERFGTLYKQHLGIPEWGWAVDMHLVDVDGDGDRDLLHVSPLFGVGYRTSARHYTFDTNAVPRGSSSFSDSAIGDIDADGDIDLIVTRTSGENNVYINDGTGVFQDESATRLAPRYYYDESRALALGDFDGDQDLDLVVANKRSGRTRLYFNDGSGNFQEDPLSRLSVPMAPTRVAAGDVDGDGDLDLVFGTTDASQTLLYINTGGASFQDQTATLMPVDNGDVLELALADMDRDGLLDLIVWKGSQPGRLLLGTPSGPLVPSNLLAPFALRPTGMALADLDADGDLDMVLSTKLGLRVLSNGLSTFTDISASLLPAADLGLASYAITVDDADGDGDLDLFVGAAPPRIYINPGSGPMLDTSGMLCQAPWGNVVLADLDGDADLDMLTLGYVNAAGAAHVVQHRNDGYGRFTNVSAATMPPGRGATWNPYAMAGSDLDGDGDLDLAIARNGAANEIYLGDGAGNFQDATPPAMLALSEDSGCVALGDLDGDGDDEIFFSNWNTPDRLYRNDGGGAFSEVTAAWLPPAVGTVSGARFADLDGDGDLDMLRVVQRNPIGALEYLENDGTGRLSDRSATALPAGMASWEGGIGIGDYDSDGDLDVACERALLENSGAAVFTDATAQLPGAPGIDPKFFDIDGDGHLDYVSYQTIGLGDGQGGFTDGSALLGTRVPRVFAHGDLDGDGDTDIAGSWAVYWNLSQQVAAPFSPELGVTLPVEVFAEPALANQAKSAIVWMSSGRAATSLALPGIGSFHLDPGALSLFGALAIPAGSARTTLSIAVPNLPRLGGLPVYFQGLILHGTSPVELRLSNLLQEVILP